MSAVVLSSYVLNHDAFDKDELLEKCGEIFLEKQLGNLIYLCTLCDDRFKDVTVFTKHISDMHISVDSCISFDPNESDEDAFEKYDQMEEYIKQDTEQTKEIDVVKDEYHCASEDSILNNEEIFNIIDSSNTVLDIQVYEDNAQLEMELKAEEKEAFDLESTELQDEVKTESELENPIGIEDDSVEVSDLGDPGPGDEELNVADGGNELDVADASDKEILRSKIRCKYCGEQFEYVKQLRKHDCGLKKGKKLHYCSECGKMFKKKSGLDIHMMIHNGEKPHKCDICGAAYACKQNLIVHVRRHTGEKPFKCNFCDRRFASSTEKISHMRTHTGERPFVCDMCGKAHTSSSQLTEHMHRHLDIRNYACEICEKRFRNSYNLRMHRLTHEDAPRKFTCEHCLSAFKTQSNLLQHIKIHQKEKKYVCKICGRAFAQHPGLYSHMKSHAIFK